MGGGCLDEIWLHYQGGGGGAYENASKKTGSTLGKGWATSTEVGLVWPHTVVNLQRRNKSEIYLILVLSISGVRCVFFWSSLHTQSARLKVSKIRCFYKVWMIYSIRENMLRLILLGWVIPPGSQPYHSVCKTFSTQNLCWSVKIKDPWITIITKCAHCYKSEPKYSNI